MFEKEAKKWVKENTRTEHSASFGDVKVEPSAEKGFQKGAEFGYNLAKEEMDYLNQHWKSEEERKTDEWHNINDIEPSKEQFGKQLLIKMESVVSNTDYAYLVYKYNGESIADIAGILAWKEIE